MTRPLLVVQTSQVQSEEVVPHPVFVATKALRLGVPVPTGTVRTILCPVPSLLDALRCCSQHLCCPASHAHQTSSTCAILPRGVPGALPVQQEAVPG